MAERGPARTDQEAGSQSQGGGCIKEGVTASIVNIKGKTGLRREIDLVTSRFDEQTCDCRRWKKLGNISFLN